MTEDNYNDNENDNKKPTIYKGIIGSNDLKEVKKNSTNKPKIYKGTIGDNELREVEDESMNNLGIFGSNIDDPFFNNNIEPFNPPEIYNPIEYDPNIITNQNGDYVGLSEADKNILYPIIIEHLDLLWKKGGYSVEYVKEWGFQESEVNEILKKANISGTEKKQKEAKKRVKIILFIRYFDLNDIIKKLDEMREGSPNDYEKLKEIMNTVQNEFENSMGKKFSDLHSEFKKMKENEENKSGENNIHEYSDSIWNKCPTGENYLLNGTSDQKFLKKLNLDEYINPIIDKYLNKVNNFRKKQLRFGLGYIPEESKNLIKVYNNRRKFHWVGIIYRITELIVDYNREHEGRILYGFTTFTLDQRWDWYKICAINGNFKNQQIHDMILTILNRGEEPDKMFKREVVEVHFDENLMRERERFWIRKDFTQNPMFGFNTNPGGEGGSEIEIPLKLLIKYIAQGDYSTNISEKLQKIHNINASRTTINRRICQNFGSLKQARKRFLKPILADIIKDGFRPKDIIEVFGIHGRNIVDNSIPEFFDGKGFLEIKDIFLREIILNIIPKICYKSELISRLPNFGEKEIDKIISNEWGSFYEARISLIRPIVIQLLRKNWSGPNIFVHIGYKYSNAYGHHNKLMEAVFGLDTETARKFFKTEYLGPAEDYIHKEISQPFEKYFSEAKELIKRNKDRFYSAAEFIRDLGGLSYADTTINKKSNQIIRKKFFGLDFDQLKEYILKNRLPSEFEEKRNDFEKYLD